MVVSNPGSLNSTDTAVQNRLTALSFTIILADDDSVSEGDTINRELVYISDSVNEGALGGKLCDARAPILITKAGLYDDMNMTASGDSGAEGGQTAIDIVDSGSSLAAGLSGNVTIYTGGNNIGWGNPKGSAQQVASIVEPPPSTKVTIFAYGSGANITCGGLPARRVAFPLSSGATLTIDGWRLFDATVNWAANP
jgi:hypothetical protein